MPMWKKDAQTGCHTLRGATHSARVPKRRGGSRYDWWRWEVKPKTHKAYAEGMAPTCKEAKRVAAAVLQAMDGTE